MDETIDLSNAVVGESVILGPDGYLHPETEIGAEDKLKPRINEMVYPMVAGSMSINQFEELTVSIYEYVMACVETANDTVENNK